MKNPEEMSREELKDFASGIIDELADVYESVPSDSRISKELHVKLGECVVAYATLFNSVVGKTNKKEVIVIGAALEILREMLLSSSGDYKLANELANGLYELVLPNVCSVVAHTDKKESER